MFIAKKWFASFFFLRKLNYIRKEFIFNPNLLSVKEKLLGGEYTVLPDLVADIRLMLENAYTYYGPVHNITKKGLRLEHMLEQKLALLSK